LNGRIRLIPAVGEQFRADTAWQLVPSWENIESGGVMTESKSAVTPPVGQALNDIVKRVSETRFTLRSEDFADARTAHSTLTAELNDYVLPRINRSRTPFLIAVGGSTGAGKSTLVNSLVGRSVSPAGVRRPTTGNPVVIFNPTDAKFFESEHYLPDLPRSSDPQSSMPGVVLIADENVEAGTAILDCPDIDSISETNRALSRRVLLSADLWLFVTTANRYADAAPWALLKTAAARSTSVAIVLDRVPPEANREVRHHLSSLLADAGLANSPIFSVAELELEDGLLPHAAIYPIRSWISQVGTEGTSLERIRNRTLTGAIAALPARGQRARRLRRNSGTGPHRPGRLSWRRASDPLNPDSPKSSPTDGSCTERSMPAGRTSWAQANSSADWSRRWLECAIASPQR
jgi:energy-coupling factor transporter ATP-binding protein EcfA2